jgi:hypothetical protein
MQPSAPREVGRPGGWAFLTEGCQGATVNRDLCALSAFFTWLQEEKNEAVTRPHYRHEEESSGRERWLSADELRSLLDDCPAPWRVFYAPWPTRASDSGRP